jgi:hypothetical protein
LVFPLPRRRKPAILRPTLNIRLQFGPHGNWRLRALVDTGAPITFFDRGAGEAIGIRFGHSGAETATIKIFGGTRPIQFEHVVLALNDYPEVTWDARVAFVTDPTFQMPFQGVLGTQGFQDRFAVVFNAYYNYFIVHPADAWHDATGATYSAGLS